MSDLARDDVQPLSKEQQLKRAGSGIGLPKSGHKLPEGRRFRRTASATERAEIRDRKLGPCIVCLYLATLNDTRMRQPYASTLHHVVPRDRGGDDVAENEVSVCGHGTIGHHGALESGDPEICQAFAAALQQYDGEAYAYAIEQLGEDGFLRLYRVKFEHVSATLAEDAA